MVNRDILPLTQIARNHQISGKRIPYLGQNINYKNKEKGDKK